MGRWLWVQVVVVLLACAEPRPDVADRTAALQDLLLVERDAHLLTDAEMLGSGFADTVLFIEEGERVPRDRDSVVRGFVDYFDGAYYRTWRDRVVPTTEVSADGSRGSVARSVYVSRHESEGGSLGPAGSFVSDWLAEYSWTGGEWRLIEMASTVDPVDEGPERILAAARRAIGGDGPSLRLQRLIATAEVSPSTGDPYRATVISTRTGDARLEFSSGFVGVIRGLGGWSNAPGGVEDLDEATAGLIRGHEVHMAILAPETRFSPFEDGQLDTFAGLPALAIRGQDRWGGEVELYFEPSDTLPLGYRVLEPAGGGAPVDLVVTRWTEAEGLRIPAAARFQQGEERFDYEFGPVELNPTLPDSTWRTGP